MSKKFLLTVCILATVLYPFIIYIGISTNALRLVLPLIAAIFILRIAYLYKAGKAVKENNQNSSSKKEPKKNTNTEESATRKTSAAVFSTALLLILASFAADSSVPVLYYPVAVNGAFLIVFAASLFTEASIITRLAKLTAKEPLDDRAIKYTRTVTKIWCIFFLTNGSMSFYTVISGDLELWTLYNGLVSYILMGILFAVEYLVRIILIRKAKVSSEK